ncbi:MAG TPA: HD domain-containing protein [Candidatus Polarisedimenticolia bacterium]|nr:HD domain-containing protein [Candidatus Polarisedimenticolia bacterium]
MMQPLLEELARLAAGSGSRVYLVGGYLRDRLLGREPVDVDLLVEGDPAPFLASLARRARFDPVVFSRKTPVTYRTAVDEWLVDVSSFPRGRLGEELARRDFTINALAAPLDSPEGPIIDPTGGLPDLLARTIRHVSPESLDEDPVRLLRAVRLAVTLDGFVLHAELRAAMGRRAAAIAGAAAERVLAEMELILAAPRAGAGARILHDAGLLTRLLPELAPLEGLAQNRWHRWDALEHTLRAVEEADALQAGPPPAGFTGPPGLEDAEMVKWAALLHDTGKAATRTTDASGQTHFHGHETVSAELARRALARLRMPSRKAGRIELLVASHLRLSLLSAEPQASERGLRRLLHLVKSDTPLLCLLALADRRAAGGEASDLASARLEPWVERAMEMLQAEGERLIAPAPLLSGHDVMAVLGIGAGPRVGAVLRWLTRRQVDGRLKTREEAMEVLHGLPASTLLTLDEDL